MNKIISYITFIPWVLYYSKSIINGIKSTKDVKSIKIWYKKNKGRLIPFESLLIIAVYVYFSLHNNTAVIKLLFAVINLYFFINTFYDSRVDNNKKLTTMDISPILIAIILSFAPFIYFIKTNNLRITYYILYGYSFFSYLVVVLSRLIDKFLNKLFNK